MTSWQVLAAAADTRCRSAAAADDDRVCCTVDCGSAPIRYT